MQVSSPRCPHIETISTMEHSVGNSAEESLMLTSKPVSPGERLQSLGSSGHSELVNLQSPPCSLDVNSLGLGLVGRRT